MLVGILGFTEPNESEIKNSQKQYLKQFWTGTDIVKKGHWQLSGSSPLNSDDIVKYWLTADDYCDLDQPVRKATPEEEKLLSQIRPYPRVAAENLCKKVFSESLKS